MFDKYKHIVSHISACCGVVGAVADWARAQGFKKALVVCDPNTLRVAGRRVIAMLKDAGVEAAPFCFPDDEPLPDEQSIGRLLAAYSPDMDIILGVGSGTINDLCTFVGARVGRPSAIVGTAPSMDGYASLGSAMLLGGVKITPPTQCASAIFCDTDILKDAPSVMLAAGLGDMLGKITSLADWRLSHIITGEPMPQDIYSIMQNALDKVVKAVPGAAKRDPAAIESITEGLILSGIAMSLYGDSRPASGTEHHLAHFWEMRSLMQGRKPALHGIKVGLATVAALAMWKKLIDDIPSADALRGIAELQSVKKSAAAKRAATKPAAAESDNRLSDIRRLYGPAAENILQTENPRYSADHIAKHWDEVLEIARSLPSPEDVASMLSALGMDARPKPVGISSDMLRDGVLYARERKKTYTLLQLLGNLGKLGEYGEYVDKYFSEKALRGVKCFVLDMDGTIYLGDRLFPYTRDFLRHLESRGKCHVFFTNNSSQNASHYLNKLRKMGIDVREGGFLMSTHVLLDHLKSAHPPPCNVFVAGTQALMDDFTAAGYVLATPAQPTANAESAVGAEGKRCASGTGGNPPDFAVLGFDTDMDYARLTQLCDYIRAGVPVYGVNMDYNCPIHGGFIPDCGSLAAAVRASTGVQPEFFGKPSRRALDYIIKQTGYSESELCFVGDRLYTDIAIAGGSGARSVLVLSGEASRADLDGSPHIPDLVVDDLSSLMAYI